MKIYLILFFLVILKLSCAQISTMADADGSILISPRGLIGSSNSNINYNVSFGPLSLNKNSTGTFNTAIGASSIHSNTDGSYNTSTGFQSLYSNTTGYANVAFGYNALFSNTTGRGNSAFGDASLFSNTTGGSNIGIGSGSLFSNTYGGSNTAIGSGSLFANTTGIYNTGIGYNSLRSNITGHSNTAFGYEADVVTGTLVNATAIGFYAIVNDDNKMRFGNSSVTVIEGQVPWSVPSDIRLKENILKNEELGLNFILKLNPMRYNYISDNSKKIHDGFIAQEVEEILNNLKLPFSGIQKSQSGIYSLSYSDFIMPIVNSIKEQQEIILSLSKKNEILD